MDVRAGDFQQGGVRRAAGDATTLDDALFEQAVFGSLWEKARSVAETRELYERAVAPLARLIAEDEEAAQAAGALRERAFTDVSAPRPKYTVLSGSGSAWSFDLHAGLNVFSPPYDYQRTSTHGDETSANVDPVSGRFSLLAWGRDGQHGALGAWGAVGIGIESGKNGLIEVRPYLKYDYWWGVSGFLLSAFSEGHVGCFVAAEGGPVVSNSGDQQLWSHTTQTNASGSDAGVAWEPAISARFLAEANRRYEVWIWASLAGDQSGQLGLYHGFSNSYAQASYAIPFACIEVK